MSPGQAWVGSDMTIWARGGIPRDRSRANIDINLFPTNYSCIPNIDRNRYQTGNIHNNQKYLCPKEHFRVEFGVELDNTPNMSSREEVPDPTKPAVSNRLPTTAGGSGIILKPSHHDPLLLRTNTRLPASGVPTVGIGGEGEFLEQCRHRGGYQRWAWMSTYEWFSECNYEQFKHRCVD